MSLPAIRRATLNDSQACHEVMWTAVTDLGKRRGTPLSGSAAEWWESGERLQRFLDEHAAEWWVAEQDSRIVGYARSIERQGLFELTEFFVMPAAQSRGIGRQLVERAFPNDRGQIRSIIATIDERALRRYYDAGTVPRFPILTLSGAPHGEGTSLSITPLRLTINSTEELQSARKIELAAMEFARAEAEIRWLLGDREGYLYLRGDEPVGFAFIGKQGAGPIAAAQAPDLPEILLHVESRAAGLEIQKLEFQVPAPNEVAARHLLGRGFRIDPWVNVLMSNRPFGRFDRFLGFGPPIFL